MNPIREVKYTDNDQMAVPATGAAGFGEQFKRREAQLLTDKFELERLCRDLADALEAVMECNAAYFPQHIAEQIAAAIEQAEAMGVR